MPYYQVLIYKIYILPQLQRFKNIFQTKLANKEFYKNKIGNIRLRLQELQETDNKAQELKQEKVDGFKKIDDIFHYQSLPYIPEAI